MVSTTLALGVTVATLVTFTLLGVWYARTRVASVEDYVSARNSAGRGMTTASLVASSMGAWILFSPAEAGAAFGGLPAVAGYAVGSAVPLLLWIPVGARVRRLLPEGHALTEYVYARYGRWMYGYVLCIAAFYMFVFLAAEMTGIAGALSLVAGVPPWQTAVLVGGFVLVYTAYGGLVASLFTDTIQTLLLLPLLALGFGGAVLALGGAGEIHAQAVATTPHLLDPGFLPGVTFGVYVVFAVVGANMLNQGMWQRVYAARDTATLRRSLGVSAVAVVPMILLSGLFGVAAAGLGLTADGNASVAFFLLLAEAFPEWLTLVVVLLAVLLVTSTADTLLNALGSVVTTDLARLLDNPGQRTLALSARGVTVVVAVAAMVVGAQGYSVLSLFLLADLLAAATVVPFLAGLFVSSLDERGALAAGVAGLVAGLAFFPPVRGTLASLPVVGDVLPTFGLTVTQQFLVAFVGAIAVSGLLTAAGAWLSSSGRDLDSLGREVRSLDDPVADGGRRSEEVSRR